MDNTRVVVATFELEQIFKFCEVLLHAIDALFAFHFKDLLTFICYLPHHLAAILELLNWWRVELPRVFVVKTNVHDQIGVVQFVQHSI